MSVYDDFLSLSGRACRRRATQSARRRRAGRQPLGQDGPPFPTFDAVVDPDHLIDIFWDRHRHGGRPASTA